MLSVPLVGKILVYCLRAEVLNLWGWRPFRESDENWWPLSQERWTHTHTHKTLHCAYDFRGLVDSRLMTSGLGSNSGQIPYEKGLFLEFPLRAGVRGTWCNVFYGQRLRDEDRIVLQPLGWPRAAACDVSPTKACWGVGFTYLYKHQVRWKLRYLVTPVLSLEEIWI